MSVVPPFREALRFWLKLGCISFGGPTGQIAIMHTELVEKKQWLSERRFFHALNFCMLLPGPEATQLATYCGWLLHGTRGGIVAGVLFVLPSAILLWGLSWIYAVYGQVPAVLAVFSGLKPAVTAIVAVAVIRIARRALQTSSLWVLAGLAFVAIYFFAVPFPAIVAGAAVIGLLGQKFQPRQFPPALGRAEPVGARNVGELESPEVHASLGLKRAGRVMSLWLVIWWLPVLLFVLWQGWESTFAQEGIFFSKAAVVTFGGAYAVLPYVGQQAVEHYGWLTAPQMLDGLGLAETTPGPLIMVVQFVGFLGGWNHPGHLSPLLAGTIGAFITTWTTFVPCLLWILLGAPYIERLRGQANLGSALTAVTAAVVGVVLNLAVWFGEQVFLPSRGTVDLFALTIAILAFVALQRFKIGVVLLVVASGSIGWLWHALV